MANLDSRLSRVSDNFGVILDKALCEPEFRWYIVNYPEEVMLKYGITQENDILIYNDIIKQLKIFIFEKINILSKNNEVNIPIQNVYRKTNPNINYIDALAYKKKNDKK